MGRNLGPDMDLRDKKKLYNIPLEYHEFVLYTEICDFFPLQKNLIVTGCADSVIRVFDVKTARLRNALHGHTASVDCLCFDGTTIVSASSDQ